MPTSNATIVQCAMTGYRITCSTRSSRFRTSLHAGSGRTIMNGQTWPWVVSRHDRSWQWWPDSTSEPRYKWGDYQYGEWIKSIDLIPAPDGANNLCNESRLPYRPQCIQP